MAAMKPQRFFFVSSNRINNYIVIIVNNFTIIHRETVAGPIVETNGEIIFARSIYQRV